MPPPKNAQEFADRAGKTITKSAVAVGTFVSDSNEKYKIAEKTSAVAQSTKNAFLGLFNKAKESMASQP